MFVSGKREYGGAVEAAATPFVRHAGQLVQQKIEVFVVAGAFGLYTVHEGVLRLSAQLYPLYPKETRTVRLEVKVGNGKWTEAARQDVNDIGWATTFELEGWDDTRDWPYRLRHGEASLDLL